MLILKNARVLDVNHESDTGHSSVVVDGNPLKDISLLTGQGDPIVGIMKGGEWVRQALA